MRLDLESEEQAGLPRPRQVRKEYFSLEKTHSPTQLMLAELEKEFLWDNKTLIKDRNAYYALTNKYLKENGMIKLSGLLTWSKTRHIHIRALLKLLAKPK
jgi:hypothetical protein